MKGPIIYGSWKVMETLSISIELPMGKKRKNTIFSLQHEDIIIEGDENLLLHATEFYKDLFGSSKKPSIQLNPQSWTESEEVRRDENEQLTRNFTEEEVKAAVFDMEKYTAP